MCACGVRLARGLGEPRQASRDFAVALASAVLVEHRHSGSGVPEAVHEFGYRCALLAGKRGACVAEIVKVEVLPTCDAAGLEPAPTGTQDRSVLLESGCSAIEAAMGHVLAAIWRVLVLACGREK